MSDIVWQSSPRSNHFCGKRSWVNTLHAVGCVEAGVPSMRMGAIGVGESNAPV